MSDQRISHDTLVLERNSPTSGPDIRLSEIRMVMFGGRQLLAIEEKSGKSSAGNIILGRNAFDVSIRTARSVQASAHAHGRHVTVVDTPGWWWHYYVDETPKSDRLELMKSLTLCPPGPHAFLLVIPIDLAFPKIYRTCLEQQLNFLSKDVWRHIIVLFTSTEPCNESPWKKHVRKWPDLEQLLGRCHNRYHLLNINNKDDNTQVITLLEKIEEMVVQNNGHFFKIGRSIYIADEREKVNRERANQRIFALKRQRAELKARIRAGAQHLTDIRIVIVGASWAARSSAGNVILGEEAFKVDQSRTTVSCEVKHAKVYGRQLTVVDTAGWYYNAPEERTSQLDKLEITRSVCLCPPGPHVILLTVPIAITYNKIYNKAVEEHMDLLGKNVWSHTIVLFTRGDWLGNTTIEERIENEGKHLQWLIKKCGNRYHVLNCKQHTDNTQVPELLAKIEEMVMENNGCHYVPETDSNPLIELELKLKIAKRNKIKVSRQRDILYVLLKDQKHRLSDVRIVLLGGQGVGKSTSGNIILQGTVFSNMRGQNFNMYKQVKQCVMQQRKVEEWLVSVVDTPGWSTSAPENAKEILRSVKVCSPGPHAFLLVLPVYQCFTQKVQQTVEQIMNLFGRSVWRHTIILFTEGHWLRDRPVEQYTACEGEALQELLRRCGNRYHVIDDNGNKSQVKKLLKLIEEMVMRNRGDYFTLEKKDMKPSPMVLQLLNESKTLKDEWSRREDELIGKMLKAAVVDLDTEEFNKLSYRRRGSINQSIDPSEDSMSDSSSSIGADTINPDMKVCSWLFRCNNSGASLVSTSSTQDLNMESSSDDLPIVNHDPSDLATLEYVSKIRGQKHARSLSF